jgi:5-methyltetrahydropteroyltriglutamate--homocysteine methyltransferase
MMMKRSTERILTTHTGSLPRPDDLLAMMFPSDPAAVIDLPNLAARVTRAVDEVVQKQVRSGIDVVNDGEVSKVSYSTYVADRLSGFDGASRPLRPRVEMSMFPEFYRDQPSAVRSLKTPVCTGPITWQGTEQVQRDIANLKAALHGVKVEDTFMSAASPGVVWYFLQNDYYPTDEAYVFAVADAMKEEYRAIYEAGFLLQLDCPDLAMGWNRGDFADATIGDFRKVAEMHVVALNHAVADIPPDRMRIHVCWGNSASPHVRDIPIGQIIDVVFRARPNAVSFEGANPRHAHEWKVFKDVKLPDGKVLIPGVLDSTTNFVEHPELVAERIVRYADLVGRENVIAGTDCGFGTMATMRTVHPTITWAKLQAMAEGARLASEQLWS